jgi:hypothetical protein
MHAAEPAAPTSPWPTPHNESACCAESERRSCSMRCGVLLVAPGRSSGTQAQLISMARGARAHARCLRTLPCRLHVRAAISQLLDDAAAPLSMLSSACRGLLDAVAHLLDAVRICVQRARCPAGGEGKAGGGRRSRASSMRRRPRLCEPCPSLHRSCTGVHARVMLGSGSRRSCTASSREERPSRGRRPASNPLRLGAPSLEPGGILSRQP